MAACGALFYADDQIPRLVVVQLSNGLRILGREDLANNRAVAAVVWFGHAQGNCQRVRALWRPAVWGLLAKLCAAVDAAGSVRTRIPVEWGRLHHHVGPSGVPVKPAGILVAAAAGQGRARDGCWATPRSGVGELEIEV